MRRLASVVAGLPFRLFLAAKFFLKEVACAPCVTFNRVHHTGRLPRDRRLAIEQLETRDLLAAFDVLVFSKTAGFRHSSITPGIAAIQTRAAHDFSVVATEGANVFTPANLAASKRSFF